MEANQDQRCVLNQQKQVGSVVLNYQELRLPWHKHGINVFISSAVSAYRRDMTMNATLQTQLSK